MSSRFDKAAEIIEIGYNEALKHKEELVQLLEYIDRNKPDKKLPPRLRLVQIDNIEVNGISRIQQKYDIITYVRKHLKQHNSATVFENIINDTDVRIGKPCILKIYRSKDSERGELKHLSTRRRRKQK